MGMVPGSAQLRDGVAAALLTAVTQTELLLAGERVTGSLPLQHAAFAILTSSVALRRAAPLAAGLAAAVGMSLQTIAGEAPVVGGFLALLVVVASLGYHASWRRGVVGLLAIGGSVALYDVLAKTLVPADLLGNTAIVVGVWGLALAVRRSTDARVAAELAVDRATRDAVQAERRRIARDLHDSVAHAVTLMTLQAGNARERTADAAAVDSLRSIEEAGRAALDDMHRSLQVLGEVVATEAGSRGLQDLDDMVDRVRGGGLTVDVIRHGDLGALPASISATAFRVAQEALTNAVKHSGAAHATVTVRNDGRQLRVDVVDQPGGLASHGATPQRGAERGLAGLRERLALFHGALEAGRASDGGWRVSATIPLDGSSG